MARELRLKPVYLMGHLHALWHAALEQQEDGDLSSWTDDLIAELSGYQGDAHQYVSLLQQFGWLDGKLIHDWMDYAGRYLDAKYRTASPDRLKAIKEKYSLTKDRLKTDCRQTLVSPPNPTVPNQPTEPNLTEISSQTERLLTLFPPILKEKIDIYISRVANKNKSKVVTVGRKLTLVTELYNSRQRCNNDQLFGEALEASITRDACCIGYVNAVVKNKKTERPKG